MIHFQFGFNQLIVLVSIFSISSALPYYEYEEESEEGGSIACRDLVNYQTCLFRLLRSECSFNEIQCRRTCGKCTDGEQKDYCYDAMIDINLQLIADSPVPNRGVLSGYTYTNERPITDFCWDVFKGRSDEVTEFLWRLDLIDIIDNFSNDLGCHGIGSTLCQYTCGQCADTSMLDGSDLSCYRDWNSLSRHYQENPEYLVIDLDMSCPLSGKYIVAERSCEGCDMEEFEEVEGYLEDEREEVLADEMLMAADEDEDTMELAEFANDFVESQEVNEEPDIELSARDMVDHDAAKKLISRSSGNDVSCKTVGTDGPRKAFIDCTVSCPAGTTYVNLSKNDGQDGLFTMVCMGAKNRYCVHEMCSNWNDRAKINPLYKNSAFKKICDSCNIKFECVNSDDLSEFTENYSDNSGCPSELNIFF